MADTNDRKVVQTEWYGRVKLQLADTKDILFNGWVVETPDSLTFEEFKAVLDEVYDSGRVHGRSQLAAGWPKPVESIPISEWPDHTLAPDPGYADPA